MSEESTLTAPVTRVITRELAEEWALLDGGVEELHRERLEEHRWHAVHLLVFKAPDDGGTWGATYARGHTESQEMSPWDGQPEIVLTRFASHQKTITVWRAVDEDTDL